jgi:hypothetical protein
VAALDLNSVFASSSNASQQLTVDPENTPAQEDPVLGPVW